ncbi:MAG: DUF4190 domain-containing protein [bacterium]
MEETKKHAVEGEVITKTTPQPVSVNSNANENKTYDYLAIASLVFGILSLCGICFTVCCIPFGIIGIVLGIFGLKSIKYKNLAMIGLALSGFSFILIIFRVVLNMFYTPAFLNNLNSLNNL